MQRIRPRSHVRRLFAKDRVRRRVVIALAFLALAAIGTAATWQTTAVAEASTRWRHHHRHHNPAPPPPKPSPSPKPPVDPVPPVPPPAGPPPAPQPPGKQVGVAYDPAKLPPTNCTAVKANPMCGFAGYSTDLLEHTGEMPQTQGVDDTGAFRTVCKFATMRPDDPIVFPGQPGASHLHTFFGNTGTNANSTADTIANQGNGSCRGGTINRTGYWVPTMIDTKTGQPIGPDLIHVYYKAGYILAPRVINAMPQGLRMVAGSSTASGKQDRQDWSCFDGGGGFSHSPTIQNCDTQLSMNVEFPQCWNGKDLDSPDHKSHMAYPIEGKGVCPPGFPVAIPVISFHVLYTTRGHDISGWRLSSDTYDASKPGGFSVHGDWFYGWKPDIVNRWIPACVQRIASCGSHILGDGWVMKFDF
jgi:hypothetical protein